MPQPVPFWKNPIIVLVLCTLMILISYGTRQSFGFFLIPISESLSNGRVEPENWVIIMGGALAALLHLPIKERPVARLAQLA